MTMVSIKSLNLLEKSIKLYSFRLDILRSICMMILGPKKQIFSNHFYFTQQTKSKHKTMSEYGGYGDESNNGGGADYGNGGYNDTSNNEGGFQSSSQNSQSTPGGSKRKNQSSCTCTIAQVLSSEFDEDTSTYMLDGEPIGTCVFIGEIINLEDSATTTKLDLEDGTGSISVKKWNDTSPNANDGDESEPVAKANKQVLEQGMWVRVHCSVKQFNGSQQLTAHNIISDVLNNDFNAITAHFLTVVVEKLGKVKGPLSRPKLGGVGQSNVNATYGQPAEFVAQRSSGPAVVADQSSGNNLGSALTEIFQRNAPTDHGWSVDEIVGQMTFKAARADIKAAILSMCDDGALYSTIDDEHYASTA